MISVIVPARNEEKYLDASLSPLKEKFRSPHEIIVSNDQSTDRTVEIAGRYANRVISYAGPHRTISWVRNEGAKAARGDVLAFMDGDTRIANPEELFARALRAFEKDPRLVAQAAWVKVYPETATFLDRVLWWLFNISMMCVNLLGSGAAVGKLQIIRRDAFEKVGGYREDLVTSEDNDLFYRLSKIGKVRINRRLVVYHSARHVHRWGWPKTLWIWIINTLSYLVRGKSYSKEWKVVR